jgi:hypothetical protein
MLEARGQQQAPGAQRAHNTLPPSCMQARHGAPLNTVTEPITSAARQGILNRDDQTRRETDHENRQGC